MAIKDPRGKVGIPQLKEPKPVIGFFPGVWDLVHPGHVMALEEARTQCDFLIVGIQSDPTIDRPEKIKPVMTTEERSIVLDALWCVDGVLIYTTENDLKRIDASARFQVRFLGDDHKKEKTYPTRAKIVYISRNHGYSSTELKNRIKNAR